MCGQWARVDRKNQTPKARIVALATHALLFTGFPFVWVVQHHPWCWRWWRVILCASHRLSVHCPSRNVDTIVHVLGHGNRDRSHWHGIVLERNSLSFSSFSWGSRQDSVAFCAWRAMSTGKRRHVLCEFSLSILLSCLCLVKFLTQSCICHVFLRPLALYKH